MKLENLFNGVFLAGLVEAGKIFLMEFFLAGLVEAGKIFLIRYFLIWLLALGMVVFGFISFGIYWQIFPEIPQLPTNFRHKGVSCIFCKLGRL